MRERLGGRAAVKQFKYDRGWNHAEFTAGGVLLEEINFRAMESKLVLGLYLIGEFLYVTAGSVGLTSERLERRDS